MKFIKGLFYAPSAILIVLPIAIYEIVTSIMKNGLTETLLDEEKAEEAAERYKPYKMDFLLTMVSMMFWITVIIKVNKLYNNF